MLLRRNCLEGSIGTLHLARIEIYHLPEYGGKSILMIGFTVCDVFTHFRPLSPQPL